MFFGVNARIERAAVLLSRKEDVNGGWLGFWEGGFSRKPE